jgi:class 3 adenylate cyclase
VSELPDRILRYVVEDLLHDRHLVYLEVDAEGLLLSSGGALTHHGISTLHHGARVEDELLFLMGLLPCEEPKMVLAAVQTDSGACLDVHLLTDSQTTSTWVVLLDARSEHDHKQIMQQKGNELSLRSERQAQVLNAHLGKSVAQLLLEGAWPIRSSGERRQATILFSDIRDFTPFSERSTPETVFSTLNQYIPAMLDPIQEHGGIVDKIAGDAVMAVFGLLEAQAPAPLLAKSAASAILGNVAAVNRSRAAKGQQCLEAGIGITTGPVAVGLIGTLDRRGFSAIGHHVNFASRLQGQARPGEILIDEETHRLLKQDAVCFNERTLQLKGIAQPVRAYSFFP